MADPNSPADPPSPRPSWETAATMKRPVPRPLPTAAAPRPVSSAATSAAPPVYAAPPAGYIDAPADPLAAPVRYDLSGNPIAAAPSVAAPPAPFGYSAGNPSAEVWPPPPVGGGQAFGGAQVYRNNSGEQSHLPPELERLRWHWGAFFLPTFWSRRHGLRALAFIIVAAFFLLRVLRAGFSATNSAAFVAVCVLYGVAHLAIQVYFGMNGHRMGWRNRHFPGGVEEYFKVQSRWMWWGFGINALGLAWLAAFLIGIALLGHHSTPQTYGGGYSGSYPAPSR